MATPHPKYLCSSSLFIRVYSSASVIPSEEQILHSQGETLSHKSLKPLISGALSAYNTALEMGLIMVYTGLLYISTVFPPILDVKGMQKGMNIII